MLRPSRYKEEIKFEQQTELYKYFYIKIFIIILKWLMEQNNSSSIGIN